MLRSGLDVIHHSFHFINSTGLSGKSVVKLTVLYRMLKARWDQETINDNTQVNAIKLLVKIPD